MKTLENLFLDQLADLYDAENRLTKALPKMANAADNDDLRDAFEHHLMETEHHLERLEQVFASFNRSPKAKKCAAIVGLLKEGDELAADHKDEPTLDAALISAAQKVEHYEIASYGCLREWAGILGNGAAAQLLSDNLAEEKNADETLTRLARKDSNENAQLPEPEPLVNSVRRKSPRPPVRASKRTPRKVKVR